MEMGVKILGTSADDVDAAEDRERFDEILEKCEIDRPRGSTVFTIEEALEVANRLKYPVLVRPSYVLGGAGMEICLNDGDVKKFMKIINRQYQEQCRTVYNEQINIHVLIFHRIHISLQRRNENPYPGMGT